jgi:hypothetical protein
MRRPSGQFAIIVFVIFLVAIEAAGVETLVGWHATASRLRCGPRGSPVLDDLIAVVINVLHLVEIALGNGLGGPFLRLATTTAATSAASAASAPFVLALAGLGLAPCARSRFAGRFGIIVKFGVEFSPQVGAGTGFIEFKLTVRGRKLITLGTLRRGGTARLARRRSILAAFTRTPPAATASTASTRSFSGFGTRLSRTVARPV